MSDAKHPNLTTRRDFFRQASCAAVGTVALTSTIRDLRLINAAMATNDVSGYKALVCVFLSGGNDANNWIVPTDTTTYDAYAAIRGNLTLPKTSLHTLYSSGTTPYVDGDGHSYGFHPSCPNLRDLFTENKLAVVMNVGTLVRPTTRAQYTGSNTKFYQPPQLFSHSDQVTQWQTSIPDAPPTTGWGGRVADLLDAAANPTGNISMSVSLNGANTFEVGNLVSQYHVATTGAVVLTGQSGSLLTGTGAATGARKRAIQDIVALAHPNLQRAAYADVLKNAINVGDALNTNIADTVDPTDSPASYTSQNASAPWRWNTGLTGIYSAAAQPNGLGGFPNTTLGTQLKMIARLIAARGPTEFNMNRQIFFSSVGGYDTHTSQVIVNGVDDPTNVNGAHYKLLDEVNKCMFAFQRAMEQLEGLGIIPAGSVTAFTASDFSRTLPTNSQGSDHGWGSHHIIVGGATAVKGGEVYGHLPTFAINGPDDTGLGRWIPTISVDQHSATLAKWFGLDSSSVAAVFPNLSRFSGTTYGSDIGYMF